MATLTIWGEIAKEPRIFEYKDKHGRGCLGYGLWVKDLDSHNLYLDITWFDPEGELKKGDQIKAICKVRLKKNYKTGGWAKTFVVDKLKVTRRGKIAQDEEVDVPF